MKIICSSKLLHTMLEKIMQGHTKKVKVTHDFIYFDRKKISIVGNLTDSYCDEFDFVPVRWYKIMKFLEEIPEQPITLTVYDDMVDIFCIARF